MADLLTRFWAPAAITVPPHLAGSVVAALKALELERRRDGRRLSADELELLRVAEVVGARFRLTGADFRDRPARDLPVSAPADPPRGNGATLTAVDVANSLGLTASRVRQLARCGELPGQREPEGWVFDRADVEQFHRARRTK